MGHMDADKHTITVYSREGNEVFNGCTEVLANDRQLCFNDSTGKRHEFYGASYHVAEE